MLGASTSGTIFIPCVRSTNGLTGVGGRSSAFKNVFVPLFRLRLLSVKSVFGGWENRCFSVVITGVDRPLDELTCPLKLGRLDDTERRRLLARRVAFGRFARNYYVYLHNIRSIWYLSKIFPKNTSWRSILRSNVFFNPDIAWFNGSIRWFSILSRTRNRRRI